MKGIRQHGELVVVEKQLATCNDVELIYHSASPHVTLCTDELPPTDIKRSPVLASHPFLMR
jgi:hypothetical protein